MASGRKCMSNVEAAQVTAEHWRLNLAITTVASVASLSAMTVIIPFLPMFLMERGVHAPASIARWSAAIYGASFLSAAFVVPLWGFLADRYGRKLMVLRSSLGMAVAALCIAGARTPEELLATRFLTGLLGGVASASMVLITASTPPRHSGFATGILSAGTLAGGLIGPLVGGFLAPIIGLPILYLAVGGVLLLCFAAVLFFVREPAGGRVAELAVLPGDVPFSKWQLMPMLLTATLVALATMSIEPLVALFLIELGVTRGGAVAAAGLALSATALGSALAAPLMGRLADRVGHRRLIVICLILAALTVLPQAFVNGAWMLIGLRLLLGVALGGVMPCIPIVIRDAAPPQRIGQSLSYITSAQYVGQVAGPLVGATTASLFGLRACFIATALLLGVGAFINWRTLQTSAR